MILNVRELTRRENTPHLVISIGEPLFDNFFVGHKLRGFAHNKVEFAIKEARAALLGAVCRPNVARAYFQWLRHQLHASNLIEMLREVTAHVAAVFSRKKFGGLGLLLTHETN